jgi:hypothetical protein
MHYFDEILCLEVLKYMHCISALLSNGCLIKKSFDIDIKNDYYVKYLHISPRNSQNFLITFAIKVNAFPNIVMLYIRNIHDVPKPDSVIFLFREVLSIHKKTQYLKRVEQLV